jgi:hydroxymethylpyrimidine/phosphomethylpyrimidine kinase
LSASRKLNGRVLIAAGSDSGGGAGIQADIKTVTALGAYAMTAITALTAQDTNGVAGIVGVDPAFIAQQMRMVLDDIGADAVKTGMLHNVAVIDTVAGVLSEKAKGIPLVVDPVMYAKGGHALLEPDAIASLKAKLLPLAAVVTPNIPEAEAIAGVTIRTVEDMRAAARAIVDFGPRAVLLKGGHMEDGDVTDILFQGDDVLEMTHPRIDTRHTHGTGCTLASAIAAGLAQGMDLPSAVRRARAYVLEAIRTAPGFGHGHGPLNHAHTVAPFDGGDQPAGT